VTAKRAGRVPATADPVARLMVDVPLPHLDRPFDYAVPAELDDQVRAGSRVRIRFAGRLVDGYVLERVATSEHGGRLAFLERAVGEPVLTAQTAALFRAVADRWAGCFVDVARLGVPSRHAQAEAEPSAAAGEVGRPGNSGLAAYRAGTAFLGALAAGKPARAVWSALPGEQWPARLAEAAHTALAAGRGALVLVPDAKDLRRLDLAFTAALGAGRHVALSAELGPAERYRRWLAVRRGAVRAVIGTRAAAYAPVEELGLLALWDDGDDLYVEPRAPYAHARDVLVLRSALQRVPLLLGGFARTAEAQLLVESGWAHEIGAPRAAVRAAQPRIAAIGDDAELARDPAATAARLPSVAWRAARDSLAAGRPVLVQVPRGGYVPALSCAADRTPARCASCSGPLSAAGQGTAPVCRWCGRAEPSWRCPACGGRRLRAAVVGARRTAEELGRAFPGARVRTSGGDRVLSDVPTGPSVVVATPGAEPLVTAGDDSRGAGYGAVLLLDGWALLSRPDLRAAEECLRRWMNAVALAHPDARVVVGADAAVATVQALIRWDAPGAAARELAERTELAFPPATRMAALTGAPDAVHELLAAAELPQGAQLIGPTPAGKDAERMLVRAPRAAGAALAAALRTAGAARSARKAPDPVRLVLDPHDLI
jgi:primosomal protein N' (replication factor Y)